MRASLVAGCLLLSSAAFAQDLDPRIELDGEQTQAVGVLDDTVRVELHTDGSLVIDPRDGEVGAGGSLGLSIGDTSAGGSVAVTPSGAIDPPTSGQSLSTAGTAALHTIGSDPSAGEACSVGSLPDLLSMEEAFAAEPADVSVMAICSDHRLDADFSLRLLATPIYAAALENANAASAGIVGVARTQGGVVVLVAL